MHYERDYNYEPPKGIQTVSALPPRRSQRIAAGTANVKSLQQTNLLQPSLEQPNLLEPSLEQPTDVDMYPHIEPMDIAPEGPDETAAATVAQQAQPEPTYRDPAAARETAHRSLKALFVKKVSISELIEKR